MSRSKIALLIAAGVIVVVGPIVYVCLFGFQTVMAVEARHLYRKSPEVWQTPVPLVETSISSAHHKKISYFGYELELPWDDVDDAKCKTKGTIRVTAFLSGNSFWFSTFPPKSFADEVMKTGKMDALAFRRAYGEEATQSDYSFWRTILELTPDSIGPFMNPHEASTNSALLVLKAIAMPKAESGIFEIQSGDLRGFQFENAAGRPNRIIDDLYGDDGGLELHFSQKVGGPAPNLTQPEINRVLQSIHKIPAPPPAPGPHHLP